MTIDSCVSVLEVIYVTRNPMDIMVSSFHFHKMAGFLDDPGTFQEFMDKFLEGEGQPPNHMTFYPTS